MSSESRKNISIRVSGNVQGVFYRASTADKARELDIKGYVRNERDGSVFIEAEGDEKSLQQLIDWSKAGPPRAVVKTCEVKEGMVKNYSSFEIQR